jgi:hypothetical protein
MAVNSYLLEPPEKGLRQKWLSGIFHSQEWDRVVGFIVTVFGHERLSAQLNKDAMQFTTKAFFGKGMSPLIFARSPLIISFRSGPSNLR